MTQPQAEIPTMTDTTTTTPIKTRLPLTRRAKPDELPRARFTPTTRDGEIIKAIYDYRLLTTNQIIDLFFPPKGVNKKDGTAVKQPRTAGKVTNIARDRLKLLYHFGYLDRVIAMGRPTVYFLWEQGKTYLEDLTGDKIFWRKTDNTLSIPAIDHLMKTNDICIAIRFSAEKHNYTILERINDATIKTNQTKSDMVEIINNKKQKFQTTPLADHFFRVQVAANETIPSFIEADLGTEPLETDDYTRRSWEKTVKAYAAYYASEKYETRYGTKAGRVLTVTIGDTRLRNMKDLTEKLGGKSRFWFTTFEQLQNNDILHDSIWSVANRDGKHAIIASSH